MKKKETPGDGMDIKDIFPDPEKRYKVFMELISDMIYSMKINPDGSIVGEWVSDSFTEVMGYSLSEVDSDKGMNEIVHPEDRNNFWEHMSRISSGVESALQTRIITKDGEVKWLQDTGRPIWDDEGKRVIRIVGAVKDITKRKNAEIELEKTNRELAGLNEIFRTTARAGKKDALIRGILPPLADYSGCDLAYTLAVEDGRAFFVSSRGEAQLDLSGRKSLPIDGIDIVEITKIPSEGSGETEAERAFELFRAETEAESIYIVPLAYESRMYALFLAGFKSGGEMVEGFEDYIRIAGDHIGLAYERLELLEFMEKRENELRKLNDRLVDSIENERSQLAIRMHDELGQILVGLSVEFDILEKSLPSVTDKNRELLTEIKEQLQKIVKSTREISYSLHPAMLGDIGLVPTLEWYVKTFMVSKGLNVDIEAAGFKESLPYDVSLALYRISQEALTNARKHSGAKNIKVRLTWGVPSVIMIIEDDGKGFNPKKYLTSSQGLGIISMRERAEKLKGSLSINSSPGKGTRVRVSIPLEDKG